MMSATRWQDIYLHLHKDGFDVYAPAQHVGECKSKYIVLKDAGANKYRDYSTTQNLYDILLYIPQNEYSKIELYKDEITASMDALGKKLMIRPLHFETPSFYDETVKAYMVSIQYELFKQL